MKKISFDLKVLILLGVLLIAAIIPTYAHFGNFLYDNGREAYYPTQILTGNVLYKNIFNVYGPFAYLFNALLYKVFGVNLNVLYAAGCVNTFLIISFTYLISRMFLSRLLSFSISFFTICVGVLNLSLFNYIFPYSYAMIYGLTSFLISFFFLLKFKRSPDKIHFLYLSSFFCGVAVANKYEFWAYTLVLLYGLFSIKKLRISEYLLTIVSFICIPTICFAFLFWQGLTLGDLKNTYLIISKMFNSASLKYFYAQQGFSPTKYHLESIIFNGLRTIGAFALLFYGFVLKNNANITIKMFSIIMIVASVFTLTLYATPEMLIFLPFLMPILFIAKLKEILADKESLILILSVYALSLKNLFGIISLTYGLFYISFWVVTTIIILVKHFKLFENKDRLLSLFLIIISILFAMTNLDYSTVNFSTKNYPLKTEKGTTYLDEVGCEILYKLFDYIKINSAPNDRIIVVPEGTFINFLTDRPSDDYLNLLTPVMFETLGEDKIIKRFKQVKPKYVIFHDNPMVSSYKVRNICDDYAFKFCDYVKANYIEDEIISTSNFSFYIFKLK